MLGKLLDESEHLMDIPKLVLLVTISSRKILKIYFHFPAVMKTDISSMSLKSKNNPKTLNQFKSPTRPTCLFKLLFCTQLQRVNDESDVIILLYHLPITKQILLKTQIWINSSAFWWINLSVESIKYQTLLELDNICSFSLQILDQQSKACIEIKCQSNFHTCWAIAWG